MLSLDRRRLSITTPNGQVIDVWPLDELDSVERDDTGMFRLCRRGDAAVILCDDARLTAVLRHRCGTAHPTSRWPKIVAWTCAATVSVTLFFWLGLPLVARHIAQAMPQNWEVALGTNTADQIVWLLSRSDRRTCDAPQGRAALNRLSDMLTEVTPPRLPLNVRVVDSKIVNALSLPGGEVLVLRGLLDEAEHPNELAAVLAHECAHSDLAHPTEIAVKSGLGALAVGLLLGDVLGGSMAVVLAQTLVTASYTREVETQADERMLETLRRTGLRSAPAAAFFDRLVQQAGDVSGPFAMLSTHPPDTVRAERLRQAVPLGADALNETEWQALKAICVLPR